MSQLKSIPSHSRKVITFLEKAVEPKLDRAIKRLPQIGLTINATHDELMAAFRGLNTQTLQDAMTSDQEHIDVALNIPGLLADIAFKINERLESKGQGVTFYPSAGAANFIPPHYAYREAKMEGAFIINGAAEIKKDDRFSKLNWGDFRNAMNNDLEAKYQQGVFVWNISPRLYFPWATGANLIDGEEIDFNHFTLLDSENDSSMVPFGNSDRVGVDLSRDFADDRRNALRSRRAWGAYVPKKTA